MVPCNYDMIYLLTAIGLSPGSRNTVHIYTQNDTKQTIHRTAQQLEECGLCPVLASYTLAFALQPRKKHAKTSVRVAASFLSRDSKATPLLKYLFAPIVTSVFRYPSS